jgi:hypothetical protein
MNEQANRNREIGPVGTVARVSAGIAALLIAALTDGFSVWNLIAGLAVLPVFAISALRLLGSRKDAVDSSGGCPPAVVGRPWTAECALLALAAIFVVAVSFVTPITEGSIFTWLGASFLLSSVLGYAGCEMVAIPNLLTGRQHRLPCFLFSAIDRAEAGVRTSQSPD